MFTANQHVGLKIDRNIEHVVRRVETREEVRARLYKVAYNPGGSARQSRGETSHKTIENPQVRSTSIVFSQLIATRVNEDLPPVEEDGERRGEEAADEAAAA